MMRATLGETLGVYLLLSICASAGYVMIVVGIPAYRKRRRLNAWRRRIARESVLRFGGVIQRNIRIADNTCIGPTRRRVRATRAGVKVIASCPGEAAEIVAIAPEFRP